MKTPLQTGRPLWGEGRAPPVAPGQVVQIAVATASGTGGTTAPQLVQLFALLSDGSIWRLQEWRPDQWDEISLPAAPSRAAENPPSARADD